MSRSAIYEYEFKNVFNQQKRRAGFLSKSRLLTYLDRYDNRRDTPASLCKHLSIKQNSICSFNIWLGSFHIQQPVNRAIRYRTRKNEYKTQKPPKIFKIETKHYNQGTH